MSAYPAPARAIEIIELGMVVSDGRLGDAMAVDVPVEKRNSRGWPAMFVAARIAGHEFDGAQIGTWALAIGDDGAPSAPCHALDEVARDWSTWGVEVRPDSTVGESIAHIATYDEAALARHAVRKQ